MNPFRRLITTFIVLGVQFLLMVGTVWAQDVNLAFASNRTGRFHVWKVVTNPLGVPQQVTTDETGSQESRGPDWSKGGRIAYQFGSSGYRSIHAINPDGDERLTYAATDERDPSWSPDGQYVAYAQLVGSDYDIWIHPMGAEDPTTADYPLMTRSGPDLRPAWSPDGKKIAFVAGSHIAVVELMFNQMTGKIEVAKHDPYGPLPQTKPAVILTTGSSTNFDPTWSPDSKQIAFSSTRSGGVDIYRMSAEFGEGDPTTFIRLTNNAAADRNPAWSPDGKTIAFVSERDGNREIYLMSAAAGETDAANLVRATYDSADDNDPAWEPVPHLIIDVTIPDVQSCTTNPTQGVVKVIDDLGHSPQGAIVTIFGPLKPLPLANLDKLYLYPMTGITDVNGEFSFNAQDVTCLPATTSPEFKFLVTATIGGKPISGTVSKVFNVIGAGGAPPPPAPPGTFIPPPPIKRTPLLPAQAKAYLAEAAMYKTKYFVQQACLGFAYDIGLAYVPMHLGEAVSLLLIYRDALEWKEAQHFSHLANDPPDPDFTQVALPSFHSSKLVSPTTGLMLSTIDVLNQKLSNSLIMEAYLSALATTADRYVTAIDVGDTASADLQRNAFLAYEDTLVHLFREDSSLAQSVLGALQTEGMPNTVITPADVALIQNEIATNGLPATVLEILQPLNLTPSELQSMTEQIITASPADVAGDLFSMLQQQATNSGAATSIFNQSPIAAAGQDQLVEKETVVILDGSASGDPNGDEISFTWAQVGGPSVTLSNTSIAKPTFTASMVNSDTELTFQLVVNDGLVNSEPDTVTVKIKASPISVTVPNVVSMIQANAQSAITAATLTVGTIIQANSATVPAGSVISQNPTAGTQVAVDSSVDLVVSLGPVKVLGDLNGDGVVSCADLSIVKAAFGKRTGQAGFDGRADTNRDGLIDLRDLSYVSTRLPVGTKCP